MRTIVLRNDDERTPGDSSAGEERRVTLFFPVTGDEYKQTRAAVEGVAPGGEEGSGPAGTPVGGRYVVTTDQQRREWGLPDLANGPGGDAAAPGDPAAMERAGAVSVVDFADALDLLFEDGASRSGAAALVDGAGDDVAAALVDGVGGDVVAAAAGGRRCGRTRPGAFVNLKHGRVRVPDHVLAVFGELCRQGRIDSLLKSLDGLIKPLERMLASGLEAAVREVAAVRGQEVTAERLAEAGGADSADERTERVAKACSTIEKRLEKPGELLGQLDFRALQITPSLSTFRVFLRRVGKDPAGNTPESGLASACDKALRGFERAAGQAVSRIRAVAAARRAISPGAWDDAALGRIREVLQRLEDARKLLLTVHPSDELEAVRDSLKEEEQQAAVPRAAATRDVLGRLEAADLPVEVLARALNEVRLSQALGPEASAVSLERLKTVASLPWTARAAERVDIEAAMAELDAAHAGRPQVKARIRRFLAARLLASGAWTVEGAVGSCRRDPSAPSGLRCLVVRPARVATRSPVLCFAGPPGGGKTALAKLIGTALGRPAVTVALGGAWDESAIRGLPTTFRTPAAGRVISALVEAKVRNPVLVLDELDKVGGRTYNHGDPSAALLEVLDPEQNTRFRDVYLDVPFDLSEVLFIATANDLAGIPAPLRDRLEVIEAPGYTDEEKVDIVRRNLWGAQLEAAGLTGGGFWTRPPVETPAGARAGRQVTVEVLDGELAGETAAPVEITDAAALEVVRGHTCEAGVRELSRQLGAICEGVTSRRVETGDTAPVTVVAVAGEAAGLAPSRRRLTVAELLGPPRYDSLPDRVRDALSRERDRVLGLHPADPEAVAAQAWLEVAAGLPWRREVEERLDAVLFRQALDQKHVGRGREKDQALDYLVARQTAAETHAAAGDGVAATLLCLAGPSGVGRTAFARALAAALTRRFVRVSLAGAADPAAIHGVARPASDAGAGRLVDALRRLGPLPGRAGDNPLVLLGELDQLGEAAAEALLRALDPVSNRAFRDRYVGLPLDLAGVLFVAAASDPGRIPPLLRERLEVLPLAGYTDAEKQLIAVRHLVPHRVAKHGLSADDLSFSPAALGLLTGGYVREPGVRGLDDLIDTVCRRAARQRAEGLPRPGEMGPETVVRWLGSPRFRDREVGGRTRRAGVALGLAATPEGGDVLVVEAARLPGVGRLRVTGTVGPMVTESANVALTWVRSNADRLAGLGPGLNDATDVHVHLGEAARSKDGPSAGVALAAAVVSALTGQPVRGDAAMTGELTLSGTVEPVCRHPAESAGGVPGGDGGGGPPRGERGRRRRALRVRAAGRHQRALCEDHGRRARGGAARRL